LEYPWGNTFDKNKCNTSEGGKGGTTSVGFYSSQGDSPYGCADMSGNVWEWTHSLFKPYPYQVNDGRENEKASGARALRGGSFIFSERLARCASRGNHVNLDHFRGFRVVASPVLS
jgi:formylglycine-generating enzyme required for sulfatase activity